jgi:hypothetical protein
MKKLFILIIILLSFSINSFAGSKNGTGELKLTDSMANYFINYIRGKQFKYPAVFYVTVDGTDGASWYCSEMTNCSPGSLVTDLKSCFQNTGKECKRFAIKRSIKWKNDINPGKGKISRINSKWSDQEIKAHLKELGFLN